MTMTRREASKLVLAGPVLAATPLAAMAQSREQWAVQLQQDLDSHLLPGCDGKLTLKAFDMGRRASQFQMAAVIELNWRPGLRRRRFDAFGDKDDAAYRALLNQALFSFAKAWPGCVV